MSMMCTSIVLFFGFLMFAMSEFDGTRSSDSWCRCVAGGDTNLMLLPSLLMSFAQYVTTRTFSEPFFDLLDEEDILALDDLKSKKAPAPARRRDHAGLRRNN